VTSLYFYFDVYLLLKFVLSEICLRFDGEMFLYILRKSCIDNYYLSYWSHWLSVCL